MSITHVMGATGSGNDFVPTVQATAPSGVAVGDLVVLCVLWGDEVSGGSGATTISSVSDGTSNMTAGTRIVHSNKFSQMFYFLSAPNAGATVFTVTFTETGYYPTVFLSVFHDDTGSSWLFDTQNGTGGSNTTANNTGNITTTGTSEVVLYWNKLMAVAATTSNPLINGVTPTEPSYSPAVTYHHMYYRILSSTFTNGAGELTYSGGTYWINLLAGFNLAPIVIVTGKDTSLFPKFLLRDPPTGATSA